MKKADENAVLYLPDLSSNELSNCAVPIETKIHEAQSLKTISVKTSGIPSELFAKPFSMELPVVETKPSSTFLALKNFEYGKNPNIPNAAPIKTAVQNYYTSAPLLPREELIKKYKTALSGANIILDGSPDRA